MNVELKQEQNEQLKVIAEQLSDVVVELKNPERIDEQYHPANGRRCRARPCRCSRHD